MNLNVFLVLFLAGTAFSFLLNLFLEQIDFSFRKKHGREVPQRLGGLVDAQTMDKTCRYEDAKFRLWLPSALFDAALSVYLALCGFYPAVFARVWGWTGNSFWAALLFLVIVSVPGAILSVPFALYAEFGIEKRFGFSNMTLGMWVADTLKSMFLSLVVALPLLGAMVALFKYASSWWWVLLGCVYFVFSLAVSVVYPLLIAPLFNTFTPLEDGELKARLERLLRSCGFRASGLFVMDASRRSGHLNAYFTGFGKSKRVVLYDTLVEQLSVDEIEAVLGHELGHYKRRHIAKRLCLMVPLVFAALFVVSVLVRIPGLYEGFGFSVGEEVPFQMMVAGVFLLGLVFEGFSDVPRLVGNFFSRRDEFQADAFSRSVCGGGEHLISALIKLNKENLSEIQVPKIYSAFNYSHPPLLERIRALER